MWQSMTLELFGGMGLLLYGMFIMSDGLRKIAGQNLRAILSTLTHNKLIGLLVGIIITVIFQSSTATSVLLVGLTNAEIITFERCLSVILGAGIGTSITAQLIALKVTEVALPIVAMGGLIFVFSHAERHKRIGQSLLGFGLLFLGLKIMGDSMVPLRENPQAVAMLMKISGQPILAVFISTLFTFLVHSSAATIGIIMALAMQGLIPLPSAIYLLFGANIGTCFTALMTSVASSREAQRVAMAHFLFRFITVLVFIPFVDYFAMAVHWLTPNSPGFQVANANTLFNVATAVIFLPITNQFTKVLVLLIPDQQTKGTECTPRYLDNSFITTPALALGMAQKEIIRISDRVTAMIIKCDSMFKNYDAAVVEEVLAREEEVDRLSDACNNYLTKLMRQPLSRDEFKRCIGFVNIVKDYEHIGDVVEKNITYLAESKYANMVDFSADGNKEITAMVHKTIEMMHVVNTAIVNNSCYLAERAKGLHEELVDMEFRFRMSHFARMQRYDSDTENTGSIFLDLINSYLRIAEHLHNITMVLGNEINCTWDLEEQLVYHPDSCPVKANQ